MGRSKSKGRKPKIVKQEFNISSKQVRQKASPETIMNKYPSWKFSYCDKLGDWAISKDVIGDKLWQEIFVKFQQWETMTWSEITVEADKENHSIGIEILNQCAQSRLKELYLLDLVKLFSFRVAAKIRLYGFKQEEVFCVLWCDKDHGDNDTCVCRSRKKHT
jgi:hypothetical protein